MAQRFLFGGETPVYSHDMGAEDGELQDKFGPKNSQEKSSREAVTVERLMQKMHEQDWRCALSGVDLTSIPQDTQLDHIVPISQGGQHTMDNVQFVHRVVNAMKRTMNEKTFVRWCVRISRHARKTANQE
jgi:5-methylcytosine-specific restriction endonuclease McrA